MRSRDGRAPKATSLLHPVSSRLSSSSLHSSHPGSQAHCRGSCSGLSTTAKSSGGLSQLPGSLRTNEGLHPFELCHSNDSNMPALSSYRDLINLSPPAVAQHSAPSSTAAAAAQLDGLAYLYAEHHGPDAYHPTPHELSHQPASRRDQLLRDLLTIRDASRGPLPAEVLQAVELWLASKSRNSPDPVVPVEEVKNIASELFPQLAEDELPAELGRVAFWRGDITRLASPQLAIVNPVRPLAHLAPSRRKLTLGAVHRPTLVCSAASNPPISAPTTSFTPLPDLVCAPTATR